jgi:hypothetical protein|tara:strand:- start:105 stop:560 length:456 start_codon:yes stop_codon:yes gene_type:complete
MGLKLLSEKEVKDYKSKSDIEAMSEKEYLAYVKKMSTDKKDKAANKKKMSADKKARADAKTKKNVYKNSVRQFQNQQDRGEKSSFDKKAGKMADNVGDYFRGTFLNKGNNLTSQDEKAKMRARKDVLGYKKGGKVRGAGIAKKGVRACKMR